MSVGAGQQATNQSRSVTENAVLKDGVFVELDKKEFMSLKVGAVIRLGKELMRVTRSELSFDGKMNIDTVDIKYSDLAV